MPPPVNPIDAGGEGDPVEELALAARTGRLVALLEGTGLGRNTMEELLRPETAWRLRAILTDRLFHDGDRGTPEDRRNG